MVTVETTPPLTKGGQPRHALKFTPLAALRSLREGQQSTLSGVKSESPIKMSSFRSDAFQIDLSFPVPEAEQWEVGTQVLWSDDSREATRVGIRSAAWLTGSELVFINDKQRKASECVAPKNVTDPKVCRASCDSMDVCIGWTAVAHSANSASGFECRLICGVVPLQAVTNRDCNWGSLHDPTASVSGMKPNWASVYIDRTNSSTATATAGPPGYGAFGYAGLVRLLPNETIVKLSVFVDKSIVEAFVQDGRATVTGRVYPSLPSATNVGVFAKGAEAKAAAWEMGAAF